MNPQSALILVNSAELRVAGTKGLSVRAYPPAGSAWSVVPQAANPATGIPGVAALHVPPAVARSLITIAPGTAGVKVLLIRSFLAESDTRPFGVTVQEQQDTNCSSGEKV